MGYRIGYNGPEVDKLLQKAYTYSVVNNGWSKLESSDTDPADLNTLVTPGNYSVSFWKNGPIQLTTSGPINVCITKDSNSNTIYQTIYDAGKIYIRETTSSSFSSAWKEEQNDTELDITSAEPINPVDNYIWIDPSGDVPVIKIYKSSTGTWENISPADMAKQSVYDSKGVNQNITTYLDTKMSEGQLDKADELYENHINATEESIVINKSTELSSNTWSSVCYGNGKYVAITNDFDCQFAYSTDGINWTSIDTSIVNSQLASLCYGNEKYVILSMTDEFIYSSDGITWTQGTMPSSQAWSSVCYGNGKYVAIAYGSNVFAYSTDGITWTQGTMPSSQDWYSICYGNDKFVVVVNNSNIFAYSTDGITWTQGTLPSSQSWQSVCYGNGKFVVISSGSNVFAYSTDGINWTQGTLPSSQSWISVCYGNGKFVAIADSSDILTISAYSTDGITWAIGASINTINTDAYRCKYKSIIYFNNDFYYIQAISLGDDTYCTEIFTSLNSISWEYKLTINRSTSAICCNEDTVVLATNTVYISDK